MHWKFTPLRYFCLWSSMCWPLKQESKVGMQIPLGHGHSMSVAFSLSMLRLTSPSESFLSSKSKMSISPTPNLSSTLSYSAFNYFPFYCPVSCIVEIGLAAFSLIVSYILLYLVVPELSLYSPWKIRAGSPPPVLQLLSETSLHVLAHLAACGDMSECFCTPSLCLSPDSLGCPITLPVFPVLVSKHVVTLTVSLTVVAIKRASFSLCKAGSAQKLNKLISKSTW